MEYRSRLKRRRKKGGGGGRILIALIMTAGLIYLAVSTNAVEWIKEHIVSPITAAFSKDAEAEESAALEDSVEVSLTGGMTAEVIEVKLPSVTCAAVQMGSYSVRENAESLADTLRAAGAGGYILEDGERFRVLASGYGDEASAKTVAERLKGEGLDTLVHTVMTSEAVFKVTADKEYEERIRAAFSALPEAQEALCTEAASFDSAGEIIVSQAALSAIVDKLRTDTAILDEFSDKSDIILSMADYRDSFIEAVTPLIDFSTQSIVDFSAELKYTQLYTTYEYVRLMEEFA